MDYNKLSRVIDSLQYGDDYKKFVNSMDDVESELNKVECPHSLASFIDYLTKEFPTIGNSVNKELIYRFKEMFKEDYLL